MKFLRYGFLLFAMHFAAIGQTEFSQENATQFDKILSVDIGPRPMGSPAEHRAMEFAIAKFKEYGCDTAYIMPMNHSTRANTTSGIAIGIKYGATRRTILIGGHIDSAGPEIPGADDDGSGASVVMECARVLGHRVMQSTIMFCCWGGEEQGLEGSKYFVEHYDKLDSVALMLQIDMANGLGIIDLDPDTHNHSAPEWLVRAAVEEFSRLGYQNLNYATHFYSLDYAFDAGAGSDHESFLRKDIPAIDFTTDVTKPIHTPRDNFENFDPRGLKRSGDVILKLVDRFDEGVPSRTTEHYWLYLLGTTPFFISFPMLWIFFAVTILIAIITLIAVRNRREPLDSPDRIRWSGIKTAIYVAILIAFGWLSSDVVAVIRGIRHPWLTTIPLYYLFAGIAMLLGVVVCVRILPKLLLSKCPYIYYKRAAIMLVVFMILLGLVNIKLIVEPAVGLLLVSLAMLFRNSILKFLFIAFSPWWTIRIIFSEWSPLIFRSGAGALSSEATSVIALNGLWILFLTLLTLPFFYGIAGVLRDSRSLSHIIPVVKSTAFTAFTIVAFIAMTGFLLSQPVYNALWQKDLHIEELYDMNTFTQTATVTSGEYMNGLKISHGGIDTLIEDKTTNLKITPRAPFDTTWLAIDRHEEKTVSGDTTTHHIKLLLNAKFRPFTVTIDYIGRGKPISYFDTPLKVTNNNGLRELRWYSFPDTAPVIPLDFKTVGNDSVKESIEVAFDSLAYPMKLENELSYVIPRTRYLQTYMYK